MSTEAKRVKTENKKKSNAIEKSLSRAVFIIFGLSALLIVLLSCFTAIRQVVSTKEDLFVQQATEKTTLISGWFDAQVRTVDTLALALHEEKYDTDKFSSSEEYLRKMLLLDSDIYCLYMGRPDKSSVFSDGWDAAAENYDPTSRDWYKKAVETKQTVVSDPYIDANTKKMVITVSKAIFDGDNLTAVLASDIFVTSVVDIANSDIVTAAYPILLDSSGNVVVHKNEAYLPTVDENENEIFTNISDINLSGFDSSVESGFFTSADYDGSTSVFAHKLIDNYGWRYIYVENQGTFFRSETILIIVYFVLIIAMIIIDTIILSLLIRKKLSGLNELVFASQNMMNGHLTYKATYRKNDEIGQTCLAIEDVSSNIMKYVSDIDDKLMNMSKGKFNNAIEMEYIGDFSQIKASMLEIQQSLSDTLGEIEQASAQVSGGSQELANGAQELSDGAAMQASAIDKLTSTFESVSAKVNSTAGNAQLANTLVSEMTAKVDECNTSMAQLTEAMANIGNMSNEIKKIIQTVEDIAFQTNILALNAAVEAARAGEAGKGFAVVADEVRNLAGKTTEAAAQTTQLIEQSALAVDNGAQLTDSTASALVSLVENAKKAVELVSVIALDAEKENSELAEITKNIEQISDVVQSNTATAEESAASSEELNAQATQLKALIDNFEL